MATTVTGRRLAHAVIALAVAGPAVLFGGVAWADQTPAPSPAATAPAGDNAAPEAPVVQPSVGSWIIGGTLLEGSAAQPAKPVTKSAKATTTTRTSTRTRTQRAAYRPTSGAGTGATALPFTGGRVDTLLPAGLAMLVGGIGLTLAARPRRRACPV